MDALLECTQEAVHLGRVREEASIDYKSHTFPIFSIEFGPQDKVCPTLVFVGGVHGLERVGTEVVLSYLRSFMKLLKWDHLTQSMMEHCRLVFYPIANPVGMFLNTRANGRGVDIMRNSTIKAKKLRLPLVGGHRISPILPWFRGWKGQQELETIALINLMKKFISKSPFLISLDVHSGFGLVDRLWFPFASSLDMFPDCHRIYRLKKNLDQTYPQHIYKIEPQSINYTAHGDIWDQLYLAERQQKDGIFLPLCLEMGSWAWIRKNPRQLMSSMGMFNPILPHRLKRTQRRHIPLFDFLLRSLNSTKNWAFMEDDEERYYLHKAKELWYPPHKVG